MDTYTFTPNELRRLLGETIRRYESRRDEMDAISTTVHVVLDLLDTERELVTTSVEWLRGLEPIAPVSKVEAGGEMATDSAADAVSRSGADETPF